MWAAAAAADPSKGKTVPATVSVRSRFVQETEETAVGEPAPAPAQLLLDKSGIYWLAVLSTEEGRTSLLWSGLKLDLRLQLMINRSVAAPLPPPLFWMCARAPAHPSNPWGIYQQKAAGGSWSFPWPGSSRTPQTGQFVGRAEASELRFELLWDERSGLSVWREDGR